MPVNIPRKLAFSLAMLGLLASAGQSGDARLMNIDDLKLAYIDCERRALLDRISTEEIARCSVLYEDLKRRAFDGDWIELWKWSQRALGWQEAA